MEHTILTTTVLLVVGACVPAYGAHGVPDEQNLFQDLMLGYEKSVRPVLNFSTVLVVTFGLKLNQIVDLDERHQVLTTNVFIDQKWRDENLYWDPANYSNVKSLRVPAKQVWLPDTFIYNNADDGSTGFMQGTYVLLNYDGTVLWPVPVKLKSSCKVDITYFPFDDQECILRFGSWIYSGHWMDYKPMYNDTPIDLSSYVNNSEWDLLTVTLKKNIRTHSCCPDPHPDMTYVLHIRRKTFYYIFNIIVPCVMLSTLTLLTFWLPPTSGEKITLGLSVFLAFSMFMLLIAEEVPATSEAVPLIGIYLCVVMTMTSLSVIMAVMVINIHNRGMKTRQAPYWLRKLVLIWISKPLLIKHDIQRVARSITLEDEREGAYNCKKHSNKRKTSNSCTHAADNRSGTGDKNKIRNRRFNSQNTSPKISGIADNQEPEVTWLREEEAETINMDTWNQEIESEETRNNNNDDAIDKSQTQIDISSQTNVLDYRVSSPCKTLQQLNSRKVIIAEWQRMAAVVDRLLFWFYFLSTILSYILILVVVPDSKYESWNKEIEKYHSMPSDI